MKDKELRKLDRQRRVKQRRLELNLTQPYVAEKMGLPLLQSRVMNGLIDNNEKWC